MLIEFSVSNYLSFKDTVTLSMVANSDTEHPENVFEPKIPGMKGVRLLKSAVVYGANASGKSNLVKAAHFMQDFVENSGRNQVGDSTGVRPFLLDEKSARQPSSFEAIFVHEGVRYQYGFSLDGEKIHEEWLFACPKSKPQEWFRRTLRKSKAKDEYVWKLGSTHLKGQKVALSKRTLENRLFLSHASQENHQQLRKVHEWFRLFFRILDYSDPQRSLSPSITAHYLHEDAALKSTIVSILKGADTGISDIRVTPKPVPDYEEFSGNLPRSFAEEFGESEMKKLYDRIKDMVDLEVSMVHGKSRSAGGRFFEFEAESTGTQNLFNLLGPWLETLEHGYALFIDEIASNMHPLLVRQLLKMVGSAPEKDGQVFFTCHQTSLLTTDLFRRDQIWFTEKNDEGATDLYPLTDIKPRKDEALEKGYLAGRYGAIPFLAGEFNF